MSQKSKRRRLEQETGDVCYRTFSVAPSSVNEQERSIEGVIATETPVREIDWARGEVVSRTLLMAGAKFPRQLPLLDNHNRRSVKDQLGSIRDLRIEDGKLVGRLFFARDAENEWNKVKDGHVTDLSAGFRIAKEQYVERGKSEMIDGIQYRGPVNVTTSWQTFEGSITPIGADEQAKLRGFDPSVIPQQDDDEDEMTNEQRTTLLSRGMPSDLDGERAIQWAIDNPLKAQEEKRSDNKNPDVKTNDPEKMLDEFERRAIAREEARIQARAAFVKEVTETAEIAGLTDVTRDLCDLPDMGKVREKIKTLQAERSRSHLPGVGFSNPRVTGEGIDTFRSDMVATLINRSLQFVDSARRDKYKPDSKRETAVSRFSRATISEIARECLLVDGCDPHAVRFMTRSEIATAVLGSPSSVGLTPMNCRDGGPYHSTGSFAYLTENAMNKNLRMGYDEAPSTWEAVMSKGNSVTDFKPKKVYITSAVGNLTQWLDGKAPDAGSFADFSDSYGVEAYAKSLDFSWQLLINDDMDALTKAPVKLGDAARRTLNAYAWSIVTSNPTLQDGQALFLASPTGNRKKANYISSGAAVTVASLSALENLMRQQVGQNTREGAAGPDILNIAPKYLVTPSAIYRAAKAVIGSNADPASGNSGVENPWQNELTVISEPLLDANSVTAWYLFASQAQVDSIEISFLEGHEAPVMWSGGDDKTLTKWWAIRQVYGGKALDHRGVAKQAGA